MASGNTLVVGLAIDNMPPLANFATTDTRNGHAVLDFDDAVDEAAIFAGILPRHYTAGGLTISLRWAATTAAAGAVVWAAAFERLADEAQDLDVDNFPFTVTMTATAPATVGALQYTDIVLTHGTQLANLAAGEAFRLKITRDADNVGDTLVGDAELWGLEIRET